jgi:hypothetical protein
VIGPTISTEGMIVAEVLKSSSHLIHEVHKIGWGIRKSERHHGILIESIPGVERCHGNI